MMGGFQVTRIISLKRRYVGQTEKLSRTEISIDCGKEFPVEMFPLKADESIISH